MGAGQSKGVDTPIETNIDEKPKTTAWQHTKNFVYDTANIVNQSTNILRPFYASTPPLTKGITVQPQTTATTTTTPTPVVAKPSRSLFSSFKEALTPSGTYIHQHTLDCSKPNGEGCWKFNSYEYLYHLYTNIPFAKHVASAYDSRSRLQRIFSNFLDAMAYSPNDFARQKVNCGDDGTCLNYNEYMAYFENYVKYDRSNNAGTKITNVIDKIFYYNPQLIFLALFVCMDKSGDAEKIKMLKGRITKAGYETNNIIKMIQKSFQPDKLKIICNQLGFNHIKTVLATIDKPFDEFKTSLKSVSDRFTTIHLDSIPANEQSNFQAQFKTCLFQRLKNELIKTAMGNINPNQKLQARPSNNLDLLSTISNTVAIASKTTVFDNLITLLKTHYQGLKESEYDDLWNIVKMKPVSNPVPETNPNKQILKININDIIGNMGHSTLNSFFTFVNTTPPKKTTEVFESTALEPFKKFLPQEFIDTTITDTTSFNTFLDDVKKILTELREKLVNELITSLQTSNFTKLVKPTTSNTDEEVLKDVYAHTTDQKITELSNKITVLTSIDHQKTDIIQTKLSNAIYNPPSSVGGKRSHKKQTKQHKRNQHKKQHTKKRSGQMGITDQFTDHELQNWAFRYDVYTEYHRKYIDDRIIRQFSQTSVNDQIEESFCRYLDKISLTIEEQKHKGIENTQPNYETLRKIFTYHPELYYFACFVCLNDEFDRKVDIKVNGKMFVKTNPAILRIVNLLENDKRMNHFKSLQLLYVATPTPLTFPAPMKPIRIGKSKYEPQSFQSCGSDCPQKLWRYDSAEYLYAYGQPSNPKIEKGDRLSNIYTHFFNAMAYSDNDLLRRKVNCYENNGKQTIFQCSTFTQFYTYYTTAYLSDGPNHIILDTLYHNPHLLYLAYYMYSDKSQISSKGKLLEDIRTQLGERTIATIKTDRQIAYPELINIFAFLQQLPDAHTKAQPPVGTTDLADLGKRIRHWFFDPSVYMSRLTGRLTGSTWAAIKEKFRFQNMYDIIFTAFLDILAMNSNVCETYDDVKRELLAKLTAQKEDVSQITTLVNDKDVLRIMLDSHHELWYFAVFVCLNNQYDTLYADPKNERSRELTQGMMFRSYYLKPKLPVRMEILVKLGIDCGVITQTITELKDAVAVSDSNIDAILTALGRMEFQYLSEKDNKLYSGNNKNSNKSRILLPQEFDQNPVKSTDANIFQQFGKKLTPMPDDLFIMKISDDKIYKIIECDDNNVTKSVLAYVLPDELTSIETIGLNDNKMNQIYVWLSNINEVSGSICYNAQTTRYGNILTTVKDENANELQLKWYNTATSAKQVTSNLQYDKDITLLKSLPFQLLNNITCNT